MRAHSYSLQARVVVRLGAYLVPVPDIVPVPNIVRVPDIVPVSYLGVCRH